jgi:hypothetical protein
LVGIPRVLSQPEICLPSKSRITNLIVAMSALCAAGSAADRISPGLWGGNHVRMIVTDAGARVEYDCATGTIDEPIALDARGTFATKGSYTPEHGGPRREPPTAVARARYVGRVDGDTMKLTVTLHTGKKPIGTFTLKRGDDVLLPRCR